MKRKKRKIQTIYIDSQTKEVANIMSQVKILDMDSIMPFGQYMGRPIRQIVASDPEYIKYLTSGIIYVFSEQVITDMEISIKKERKRFMDTSVLIQLILNSKTIDDVYKTSVLKFRNI